MALGLYDPGTATMASSRSSPAVIPLGTTAEKNKTFEKVFGQTGDSEAPPAEGGMRADATLTPANSNTLVGSVEDPPASGHEPGPASGPNAAPVRLEPGAAPRRYS